jgi:hypothetical protein
MQNSDSNVKALLIAIGATLMTTGLQELVKGNVSNRRWITSLSIGLLTVIAMWKWQWISSKLAPPFVESIRNLASNITTWIVLLAAVWLYLAVTSIISLIQRDNTAKIIREDMNPFRLSLQKYVLPRRLALDQIQKASAYLQKFQRYTVRFEVRENDEEASRYCADLRTLFSQGGWMVGSTTYLKDVRQGWGINYIFTESTRKKQDDLRDPSPDKIVYEALLQGEIRTEGGSTSGGTNDEIVVVVGERRRDDYSDFQKWPRYTAVTRLTN